LCVIPASNSPSNAAAGNPFALGRLLTQFDPGLFSDFVLILSLNPVSTPLKNLSPLCQLPVGSTGRVCELTGDEGFCQRVREMGFGEAALVTKISGTTTTLCLVNGTRIALNHRAAMAILVEALPANAR